MRSKHPPRGEMLSCVSFAPLRSRPFYSPADGDNPQDVLFVRYIGPSFTYIIPSFDVLAVSMRPMVVSVRHDGEEKTFDIFVRSESSLDDRVLPALMIAKDYALIKVCY